ncbi:MAG: hypothetical protein ACE5GH_02390 [Fidelibacterota bacterium]
MLTSRQFHGPCGRRFPSFSATSAASPDSLTWQESPVRSYGFSIESESRGSAVGAFYSLNLGEKFQGFIAGKILKVSEGLPVIDPWTGAVRSTGSSNLALIPLIGGAKYHPFVGEIANNFSPFVAVGVGPTVILDFPEKSDQRKNLRTHLYIGAFAGVGVDFLMSASTYFSLALGYDFLPMGRTVDNRRHYNGTVLKFMFGKRRG